MHISSALLLTLLVGVSVAKPVSADDSDLGFYFDDVPSEPILSKRQRGPGGNYRGGSQTQAAASTATTQGGSRSVSPNPTAPATPAPAAATGGAAGTVSTTFTTVFTGTVTMSLIQNSSGGHQASSQSNVPTTTGLHTRQMGGMGWWQHRGFGGFPHANDGSSASGVPQYQYGDSKKQSGTGQSQSLGPAQTPSQSATQAPKASATKANAAQSSQAPAATPTASSGSGSSSSGGSDSGYMSIVSKWRSAMGVGALAQDSQLQANALKTATDGKGQMVHELNPGSMAQVLAPGNAGNFESVFVGGWLCEKPSLTGLNGICASMAQGWDHSNGETGHADILSSKGYKKIGCALADGIWACDLA